MRAIKDVPGFELDINPPPPPPAHPYHTHTINDNPPVRSTIRRQGSSWTAGGEVSTQASVSDFIMRVILADPPLANLGMTPLVWVDRYAGHTTLRQTHIHPSIRASSLCYVLVCSGMLTAVCWTAF